jgi:hypothetical protein
MRGPLLHRNARHGRPPHPHAVHQVALSAYPNHAASTETMTAAQAMLACDDLDPTLRRVATDDLRRPWRQGLRPAGSAPDRTRIGRAGFSPLRAGGRRARLSARARVPQVAPRVDAEAAGFEPQSRSP